MCPSTIDENLHVCFAIIKTPVVNTQESKCLAIGSRACENKCKEHQSIATSTTYIHTYIRQPSTASSIKTEMKQKNLSPPISSPFSRSHYSLSVSVYEMRLATLLTLKPSPPLFSNSSSSSGCHRGLSLVGGGGVGSLLRRRASRATSPISTSRHNAATITPMRMSSSLSLP